jgi:hypothetical protein
MYAYVPLSRGSDELPDKPHDTAPAFTMSVYQHVLPGMQAEAAALAASLVDD